MNNFLVFGILLSATGLLGALMFISSRWHYLIKIIMSCIIVIFAIFSWLSVSSLMGYPVHAIPPQNSLVISFKVIEEKDIFLWVEEGNTLRTYIIPYNKGLDKSLKGIRQQGKNGVFSKDGGATGFLTFHKFESHMSIDIKPLFPPKH